MVVGSQALADPTRAAAVAQALAKLGVPVYLSGMARGLLGAMAPPSPMQAAREGAPVGVFQLPSEAQSQLFLAGALRDLVDREPRASVGVIAASSEAARRFHALVAELAEVRADTDYDYRR